MSIGFATRAALAHWYHDHETPVIHGRIASDPIAHDESRRSMQMLAFVLVLALSELAIVGGVALYLLLGR